VSCTRVSRRAGHFGLGRLRVAVVAAVLASIVPASPEVAFAQDASSSSQRALSLAHEGIRLYEAGRWAEADAKLTEAESLTHSPVFLLYVARCRRSAGKLIDARGVYRRVAGESLAPSSPQPWHQAVLDARAELAALEPTIPSVAVRVADGTPTTVATIDGRPAPIRESVELDPGSHQIVIVDGARRAEAAVEVRVGERKRWVDMTFAAPSGAPGAPPADGPADAPADPEMEGDDLGWVPGAVVLGVGIAGLGVGAITGVLALGDAGDVEDACPGGACPPGVTRGSQDATLDDAKAMGDVSTIAFIAGGVLTAAGVVLLVVQPFGDDGPEVVAGARSVGVRTAF
jgi:hypothetical protein